MRIYEFTVIYRTDEENFVKGKELVKQELERAEAKILKEEDLGVREMAYEIKKEAKGRYNYFEIEADPAKIAEMNKALRLSTDIMKFLIVKKGD